jgi:hypothetical protein
VSVGSEHTRNVCLNSNPSSIKETECCPLISRISPVTPHSSTVVTHMSPLDILGCSIDTLQLVSKIRLLDIPSISTEIVGVPCSNKMETVHITTALSGAFRWKERSSFTNLSHFPYFLFPVLFPFSFHLGAYDQGNMNVHVKNIRLGSSFTVW